MKHCVSVKALINPREVMLSHTNEASSSIMTTALRFKCI